MVLARRNHVVHVCLEHLLHLHQLVSLVNLCIEGRLNDRLINWLYRAGENLMLVVALLSNFDVKNVETWFSLICCLKWGLLNIISF